MMRRMMSLAALSVIVGTGVALAADNSLSSATATDHVAAPAKTTVKATAKPAKAPSKPSRPKAARTTEKPARAKSARPNAARAMKSTEKPKAKTVKDVPSPAQPEVTTAEHPKP